MAKAKKNPKVSVILTSYNHAAYLAAAIDSVLNQTFADFELLIVDDGSTDSSREIIKRFNDPRIKTFLYTENRGPVIAIRDAVNSARGKYIAVHHSDDLWTPNKLAKQVKFLDGKPNYAACFTWVDFVDEAGNVRELDEGDSYKSIFDQPNRSRAEWLNHFFHNGNCLCHPSAVVRREVYEKYHLLDVQGFWQLPDYLMWIRLCSHADIFIFPERLTQFRLRRSRQENTSATSFEKLVRADLEFYFVAQEFVYNFTDNKFFLDTFPEAERFVVNGQINRRFAFAKICLDKNLAAFQIAGLTILKNLLNSPANAAEIKTLYGYDEKSFLRDGGSYDVFNLAQKLSMMRAEVFAQFDGEYFRMAAETLSVDMGQRFYGRFDFDLDKPTKILRFDPDTDFISVKISRVAINGKLVDKFFGNAGENVGGFRRFWTSDPQFIFNVDEPAGHVTFEISGELEKDYPAIVEQTIKDFVAENNRRAANIADLNTHIDDLNANHAAQIENLNINHAAQIEDLNANHAAQIENLNANHAAQIEDLNASHAAQVETLNAHIAERDVKIENLDARNEALRENNADNQRTIEDLRRIIDSLNLQNANLHAENQRLAQFNESILNSNSWRLTEPLRSVRRWLKYSPKDKALSAGRLLYKAIPLDDAKKVALKDKFYNRFAPLLKDTERYKNWQLSKLEASPPDANVISEDDRFFYGETFLQPGKIAIQAHIFYLDLLDDMAAYCANMPFAFDALISIVDKDAMDKVLAVFEKIPNAEKCVVRIVPNRGRDVAPFLVGFGDLIPEYDFVAHIHSKKSLYTGSEQQNWRNYLFDALLGSADRIRKIFKAFDDETVGVIYPRPAENVPYAAFTWMSNRAVGQSLLARAGIEPNKTEYFDFPAGTMFWARTKALRKFFAPGLTFEDFPPEQGQNDGTIAHAFERSILLAAQTEGLNYYEFNPATYAYSVNLGCKNLWQYFDTRNGGEPEMLWLLAQGDIVSFDVFDTLIMRYVAQPRHVNEIIRFKVEDLLGREFDFPTLRLKAEELARQKKGGDVNLYEIYGSFAELTELDADTCKQIRELEISTELELILPREDVVAWFKEILKRGREVWLISDMYMQTPELERLLKKCGVEGYGKLLVSCETNKRKDTAAIWNYLAQEGFNASPKKIVHIGDNETSDLQLPGDRSFGIYHLMSAINLFSQTLFGRSLLTRLGGNLTLYAGILLGVTLAKKFQSPYRLRTELTDGTHHLILKDFRELGYWFYGAPLLTFMLWLIQKTRADGVERIFFLARDGYFLRRLYKFVAALLNVTALPSEYFMASRRAVTVASIRDISQAKELIKLRFEGTQRKLFRERFGMELGGDEKIVLPNLFSTTDCESVAAQIIDEHSEEILNHAAAERGGFEKYIANLGGSLDKVGVVDMGYSGTIQFYLQELTGKKFTGYYFATSSTNRFGEEAGERMRGCFTENDDYKWTKSAIYRYQLLFETILTAPDAQLKHFDATGNPVFGAPEPGQLHFREISAIHEGIKDFCRDVAEVFGDILLRVPIDKNFVDAWVRAFMSDKKIIAPELREIFTLDDEYCNTFHGNALDFYLSELDRPKED